MNLTEEQDIGALPPSTAEDFLVIRVNRIWLRRAMWKVKTVLVLIVLMGGGTITTSAMNLAATLTGQEREHETHVEKMTVSEVEDLCTENGFARPSTNTSKTKKKGRKSK